MYVCMYHVHVPHMYVVSVCVHTMYTHVHTYMYVYHDVM